MGDPNASIPTPQPVHYRPMFGAFGRALDRVLALPSSRRPRVEERPAQQARRRASSLSRSRTRAAASRKKSMIHNDATPKIEVDPETYEVRADGELLDLRAGRRAADGAALFPVLRSMRRRSRIRAGGRLVTRRPRVDRVALDAPTTPSPPHRADRRTAARDSCSICRRRRALRDGDGLVLEDGAHRARQPAAGAARSRSPRRRARARAARLAHRQPPRRRADRGRRARASAATM